MEGFDDRLAVLLVPDRGTDDGAAGGVDLQLQVELKGLSVDVDHQGRAIGLPLGTWKEGLKGSAQRILIGTATGARLLQTQPSGL